MHTVIVGGGVTGILSAWYLALKGITVTLLERENALCSKASAANASQLGFSSLYAANDPQFLHTIPAIMAGCSRDLSIRKWTDPQFLPWAFKYLGQCQKKNSIRSTKWLLEMGAQSRILIDELRTSHNLEFSYQDNNRLRLYETQKALEAGIREYGVRQTLWPDNAFKTLSSEECLRDNPVLESREGPLVGGLLTYGDSVGNTVAFCEALTTLMKTDDRYDVTFRTGITIKDFIRDPANKASITAVRTADGEEIKADHFLLCAGCWSPALVKPLGLKLDIYPVKGCSITIPDDEKNPRSRQMAYNLTDVKRKIVIAPWENAIRVSAGMLFDGYNDAPDKKLVSYLQDATRANIPGIDFSRAEVFTGLRPLTPDSLPLVKKTELDNLFMNTGHGKWGWTLAPATGKMIADIIEKAA